MDEDTVTGAAKQVEGTVTRGAGALFGDEQTEARGAAEEISGKTQRLFGSAKEEVREAIDNGSFGPILAGVAVGITIGLFLNRR